MKVLHLTHHFWPCIGGIEKFVYDLAKALKAGGIETEVATLNKCSKSKELLKEIDEVGKIKVCRMQFIDLKYYKIATSVFSQLKNCDVIHVHNIGFFLDAAVISKFLHKRKIVFNTHGGIFHTKKFGLLKKFYFNFWLKFLLNGTDKVIADSKQDFELFSKIVSKKKLVLIENGIGLSDFYNSKKEKLPNTFVFVGRFSKNKRIKDLIECFAVVSNKRKDWNLKIVGEDFDNLKQEILKLISEKGLQKNIELIENLPQKQLVELLSKTRFFVSASEYEGFGISVIEAMASECVPILNNIESFNTIIENNENGFLVEFKNPKKTAEQLLNFMNLNLEKLKKTGWTAQNSTKRFSLDKVIEKYAWEYEIALKGELN